LFFSRFILDLFLLSPHQYFEVSKRNEILQYYKIFKIISKDQYIDFTVFNIMLSVKEDKRMIA